MKRILIFFITGASIASISFFVYKLVSLQIEKERKIAEELLRKENGQKLLNERIKHNGKRMVIIIICSYLCLGLIGFIVAFIIALIGKYLL